MREKRKEKITFDGSIYREHLILYMDILGYSDLMLYGKEAEKQSILDLQSQLLTFDKAGYWERDGNKITPQPLTTLLSDTFVCSYPMENLERAGKSFSPKDFGVKNALLAIQSHSVKVHRLLLNQGMLIRGAVVIGKLVNHDGMAYGEGLAKAADLEREKLPFVYYEPAVLNLMHENGVIIEGLPLNKCIFNCPKTNAKCYDWLQHELSLSRQSNSEYQEDHMKFLSLLDTWIKQINEKLVATQEKERAHKKWRAVAEHFDRTVKEYNTSHSVQQSDQIYRGEQIHFP